MQDLWVGGYYRPLNDKPRSERFGLQAFGPVISRLEKSKPAHVFSVQDLGRIVVCRFRTKRQQRKRVEGPFPGKQGQNAVVSLKRVAHWLDG
jgi:hypothetical protein